jgi:hypothetical protein
MLTFFCLSSYRVAQHSSPEQATLDLIKEAKKRWLKEEEVIDDTTVCVAFIGSWKGGSSLSEKESGGAADA